MDPNKLIHFATRRNGNDSSLACSSFVTWTNSDAILHSHRLQRCDVNNFCRQGFVKENQ